MENVQCTDINEWMEEECGTCSNIFLPFSLWSFFTFLEDWWKMKWKFKRSDAKNM
jgi:hypothetical protein